jgi:predicted metal-dependent HD superfamily phosphohydrolase
MKNIAKENHPQIDDADRAGQFRTMTSEQWFSLMANFGFSANEVTYQELAKAYGESHRHYHNRNHIEHSIATLHQHRDLAEHPDEVELALWFHDAVYKPFSSTNELDSANWAISFLKQNGANPDSIERVNQLILATLHEGEARSQDEKLLVDIDLAILGISEERFALFEKQIRAEYRWVPWFLYRKKRKEVLSSFLERDSIYATTIFAKQLEQRARNNIKAQLLKFS